jgi:hypothetical protein
MNKNFKLFLATLVAAPIVLLSEPAHALAPVTPAISFGGGSLGSVSDGPSTYGFQFTVGNPLALTALGFWDEAGDGLQESHMVGIFTTAGALVASALVPAGTGGTLISGFRYVSLAVALLPGTYNIGAFYGPGTLDRAIFAATGFSVDPQITYNGAHFAVGGFVNPSNSASGLNPGVFGPNFLIAPAAPVPAPEGGATLLLLAMGVGGLFVLRQVARVAA